MSLAERFTYGNGDNVMMMQSGILPKCESTHFSILALQRTIYTYDDAAYFP